MAVATAYQIQGGYPGITLQGSSPNIQGSKILLQGQGTQPGTITTGLNKVQNNVNQAKTDVTDSTQAYQSLLAQIKAANQQVYAPKLDLAAINAQARQSAENAVNPYYTKTLNDFLSRQAAQRQQQQTQYETGIKNLEDNLKQTLEDSQQQQQRTTEDVAQNQGQINQTADEFQTDTGSAFDIARRAEAAAVAKAGLTGGLGAQQAEASQLTRNTAEKRQEGQFTEQRVQQELFKARTFEDLTKAAERAKTSAEKGKTAAKFDLDTYIQNQNFETEAERNTLEAQRLQGIGNEQQNQARLLVNSFINKISNPAQRQAAIQTYGGIF